MFHNGLRLRDFLALIGDHLPIDLVQWTNYVACTVDFIYFDNLRYCNDREFTMP